uniref:Serine/threonine-protein kinase TAO1-A n=1 Tax=Anthurium amnicola TaxID=1678845 RepID=A0A1D1Y5X3_9ARAE
MAANGNDNGPDVLLKPFYQRASEAEERLARLEAVLSSKNGERDASEKELSSIIKDFQTKVEFAQHELMAEREKASKEIQKLKTEIAKLQYRTTHLIRALKEADSKLEDY